ncbi:MAG TPA: hypothetical protein VGN83_20010 [Falsiroseomonas sp.]|jgi:flagellar biosynthesis/type III secretory pathway protein FliH|nr:hypothetical protein [Falsiroseomonas sp.]
MRFALPLPDLSRPPPVAAPTPPDPALLEAVRAEGEADGHARGFAEGLEEGLRRQAAAQQAHIAASLGVVAAVMESATRQGTQTAEEAAEALASTLLAAMDAALPGEAARCGEAMIARLATMLLPALADRPEAKLLVAPSLVEGVAARLPEGPAVVGDAVLPPGDARIEWRDGARIISLERRREAVRAALEAAGFRYGSDDE